MGAPGALPHGLGAGIAAVPPKLERAVRAGMLPGFSIAENFP
jgi:hypothetical protein